MDGDDLPKYRQIAEHYRARILNGDLRAGDEVPSERALAVRFDVARPTATKALEVLRRDGLVESITGSGTYVTARAINRRPGDRYQHARDVGRIYSGNERAVILAAEVVVAVPDEVNDALQLGGTPAIRRLRVTLDDGEPVEVSTSWFDARIGAVAPAVLERDRILSGTLAYVEQQTGRRGVQAQDYMAARAAAPDETEALGLASAGSPVLVVNHVVYDESDEPLEFAQAVYPPDRWAYERRYNLT